MINPRFPMAAIAAMMLLGGQSTYAADLGGNCCADLEERVAELEATTARKGNRKQSLTVYGQVNAEFFFRDGDPLDTDREDRSVIQNETRFGFRGESKVNSDVSAGFRLEIAAGDLVAEGTGIATIRQSYVHITSKSLGTVSLGLQKKATHDITRVDLSKSQVASETLTLRPADRAVAGGTASPFDDQIGHTIKYQTPSIGGFSLSASWEAEQSYDAALRFANEFGGIRVAAGVGYRKDMGSGVFAGTASETIGASASIKHVPSGLFLNGSYGNVKLEDDDDLKAYAVRGGLETSPFKIGSTTLYAEWAEYKRSGETGELYGAGIMQSIDPAAMDIYLSWRHYEDDVLLRIGEQDVVRVGVIARF